jgi:hypothetical protein
MRTIVWDVDDVLNNLMRDWFHMEWIPNHPTCALRYEDLILNPPHSLLGVSLDEYLCSLDRFRRTAYDTLEPVPEVVNWFRQHGDRCRHVALTAVPLQFAPLSSAWVFRHFGTWIRSFHFVPSPRSGEALPNYDHDKLSVLKAWNWANAFVDDSVTNVCSATTLGLMTILFPRPWNGGSDSSDCLHRLNTL